MGEKLLSHFRPRLAEFKRLLVVPDGALHLLPFEALVMEELEDEEAVEAFFEDYSQSEVAQSSCGKSDDDMMSEEEGVGTDEDLDEKAEIEIDRKMLADIAVHDMPAFEQLAEKAKAALAS